MTGPAGAGGCRVVLPFPRGEAAEGTAFSCQNPRSESRWMALVLGRLVRVPTSLLLTATVRLWASMPAKARRRIALPCSGLGRSKRTDHVVAELRELPVLSVACGTCIMFQSL